MKNKILYSLLVTFLSFALFGCQEQNSSAINKRDGKMPVVTTNEIIAIHTRMIAADHAFVVALDENGSRPSASEKELIYDAGVIISDFPIA
jgi:ABC-type Zn uptake system ZnuABC Zn-binding protein ZnuA